MSWETERIREFNRPSNPMVAQRILKEVKNFLQIDNKLLHHFHITYLGSEGTYSDAQIKVFLPDSEKQQLIPIGTYNLGTKHLYLDLYRRISSDNILGEVDEGSNLLYNGIFGEGIDGWIVESQQANATVEVVNGILKVSDTVANDPIILLNNRTVLDKLETYRIDSLINESGASASIQYQIGTQLGVVHSSVGPTTETISANGSQFRMIIRLTDVNQSLDLNHIILYKE